MTQLPYTEERLFRYLLGSLPEVEREALETEYFSDPVLLDRLDAAELDLVEGYVNDKLDAADRERFERVWLTSPQRREKLAFFQALKESLPPTPQTPTTQSKVESASWWKMLVLRPAARPAWPALALAVCGVLWLARENWRLREYTVQGEQERASLKQRESDLTALLAAQNARSRQLSEELAALRNRPATTTPPPVPAMISFLWTLTGLQRMPDDGRARTLTIPYGTALVQINLKLATDRHSNYQLELRAADGQTVWKRENIKADNRSLSARIPAAYFHQTSYQLILRGQTAQLDTVEVGVLSLQIVRR